MSSGEAATQRHAALATIVESASPGVAALALDVLSRQAEARVLFAGKDFATRRAAAHDVEGEAGIVGGTDVRALIERGPSEARDYELLGGLALRGLLGAGMDAAAVARFVEHAEWLDLATAHSILGLADAVLGDDAGAIWRELGARTLEAGEPSRGDEQARQAYRLFHLASSRHAAAREALGELGALDAPRLLSLASACGATTVTDAEESSAPVRLHGWVRRRPRARGAAAALRLISGWALLSWIGRGVGALTGLRRSGSLELRRDGALTLRSELVLLGRSLRESDAQLTLAGVTGFEVLARRSGLALAVGAVALSLGVLVGGGWLFDGVRTGETYLLGAGAALMLAGAGVDLALGILLPAGRGRRALRIVLADGSRIELDRLDERALAGFVTRLEGALAQR